MDHASYALPSLADCGMEIQSAEDRHAVLDLLVLCVPRDHHRADARPCPSAFPCRHLFRFRGGGCLPCPVYSRSRGACLCRSPCLYLCGHESESGAARVLRPRVIVTWFDVADRGYGADHPDIDRGCLFGLVGLRYSGCGARIRPTLPYYLGGFDPGEDGRPY